MIKNAQWHQTGLFILNWDSWRSIYFSPILRRSQSEEHPKTNFSLNDDIFVEKYHKISGFQYKGIYWHPSKIKKLLKRKAFVTQYSFMGVWPFDNFWQKVNNSGDSGCQKVTRKTFHFKKTTKFDLTCSTHDWVW